MRKRISALVFALSCLMLFSGIAAAQSRTSVPASEVNGTFRMNFTGKYKGSSNEVKILALGGGKLHVAMDLVYPYKTGNGELMANMGSLDGEARIDGDTAVYSATEFGTCTITIKFIKLGTIKVSQEGSDSDCGFGHNVRSDGTYKKVSAKKPTFETR